MNIAHSLLRILHHSYRFRDDWVIDGFPQSEQKITYGTLVTLHFISLSYRYVVICRL